MATEYTYQVSYGEGWENRYPDNEKYHDRDGAELWCREMVEDQDADAARVLFGGQVIEENEMVGRAQEFGALTGGTAVSVG